MKKLSLLALTAVALVACGDNNKKTTPEDFKTIENELQVIATNGEPLTIVSLGTAGDYLLQIPKTEAIENIAGKEKTAKILSAEVNADLIKDGYCLLNIIPKKTMEEMNMAGNTCNFRLFCGNIDDTNEEFYAVEVCSEQQ